MGKRELHYGAALLAAPLFCLVYHVFFTSQSLIYEELFGKKQILLWGVIIFPVIEELAFRGMIQEYIATKTNRFPLFFYLSLSNILTSVLFAAIHFFYHQAIWVLLVFFPSLVFGYFKEQYQSIVPGIILHAFYNLNFILLVGNIS
ncbi:JDVT-CTERM system glutamic-type intramembrane protease [Sulfurovum sp. zt1-1]|uniref:JDVT-CTERM system glutamic-type intramembrane protease n=1 Tax=Sulfurovum zhangzhouensis TaxID=3019067 RepID=A0ABT7R0Z2_9BACT|nr:JDVT-CTERM system glutamic-type intramembrane protease [Sulfurovum zhangzhouensis]MDM5272166.1 JDVT-CTERM system glutamic-type intramembrane protease [Sulfurovum zhangzhouensis]